MTKYRLLSIIGLIVWAFSLLYGHGETGEVLVSVFANICGLFVFLLGFGVEAKKRQDSQV